VKQNVEKVRQQQSPLRESIRVLNMTALYRSVGDPGKKPGVRNKAQLRNGEEGGSQIGGRKGSSGGGRTGEEGEGGTPIHRD